MCVVWGVYGCLYLHIERHANFGYYSRMGWEVGTGKDNSLGVCIIRLVSQACIVFIIKKKYYTVNLITTSAIPHIMYSTRGKSVSGPILIIFLLCFCSWVVIKLFSLMPKA